MFERAYRQRLEADLARWQADGVISTAVRDAIRAVLPPVPKGIDIAGIVAVVGGLLIAAAFLVFVAANWSAIARPVRFVILLAGIAGAYGIGAWFAHKGRTHLSDISASAGSIIFGAAIALVGQMYHLGDDFTGGMLLWASGALAAAALTGSRGALAVALVAACIWNGMRVHETFDVNLPFVGFWLIGVGLAVAWNAPIARHLVALAALSWWINAGIGIGELFRFGDPTFVVASGAALLLGAGLAFASRGPGQLRAFGATLSNYGAFVFAIAVAWIVSGLFGVASRNLPIWIVQCGVIGVILAFAAAVIGRRAGPAFAGLSLGLGLAVIGGWTRQLGLDEPWLSYALALAAMLCLVISGMLDGERPRVVAGWIGLALVIAAITWAVKGSLLRRAAFLGMAGVVAVVLAGLLGRLLPKESHR